VSRGISQPGGQPFLIGVTICGGYPFVRTHAPKDSLQAEAFLLTDFRADTIGVGPWPTLMFS
jgi:hypothetical protein